MLPLQSRDRERTFAKYKKKKNAVGQAEKYVFTDTLVGCRL